MRRHDPAPLANLLAANRKVPLTSFEQALGFCPGPSTGAAAGEPRTGRHPRHGCAPGFRHQPAAFIYGTATPAACHDVAKTYMRCLDHLGANVLIQADANDGAWTGADGSDRAEHWQPLSWMGSAYRRSATPACTSLTLSTRSWSATWQTPRLTDRARSFSAGCAAAAATTSVTARSSPGMTTAPPRVCG